MRKLIPLVFTFAGLFSGPAYATGEIFCTGDDGVQVDLSISRLEVLNVLNATIFIGEKAWSTIERDDVTPIAVGQAFGDRNGTKVDFMDKNYESVIAKLRIQHLSESEKWATAGVFSLKGEGAWTVTCDEG
ncbi:MAG: hypothetical protein QNJ29_12795 [Rhizobiaceae bacterium]|nr:hypothetical protein [Rhizobiaceae bacterium]